MTMIKPLLLQNSCVSSISYFLTSPYTSWFPIVSIAVLLVIAILAVIYALSPLIGRSDIKSWVRIKIYETMFAFVLVIVFAAFSTILCTTDTSGAYMAAGLVPSSSTEINCMQYAGNLYSLSECDLYGFNNVVLSNLNNEVFAFLFASSNFPLIPLPKFLGNAPPGVTGVGIDMKINPDPNLTTFAVSTLIGITTMYILNDLQLIILDASLLIFSVLLAVGFIARVFGISRGFGGSMIALGVGIGFVLPLMVSISYGFMDVSWNTLISNTVAGGSFINDIMGFVSGLLSILSGSSSVVTAIFGPLIAFIGFTVLGALFLPILDFIIVDTFVIDFSQAIGERIDFMSLLQSVI